MTWGLEFFVRGIPAPQGSKTVFRTPQGRMNVVEGGSSAGREKHAAWREAVHWAAVQAMHRRDVFEGPVQVGLEFGLPRPKSVKRYYPSVKPDIDKLVRSVLDALTGPVLVDDCQVVQLQAVKHYAKEPGCRIFVIAQPESTESAPAEQSTSTTASCEAEAGATSR